MNYIGGAIDTIAGVLLIAIGILLGHVYATEKRFTLAILGSICAGVPLIYALFFPVSSIDHLTQVQWWWTLLVPVLVSGITLVILCLYAPKPTRRRKWTLFGSALLVCIIFMAPIHRPHSGWGPHAHYIWENPFHVH